MRRWLPRSSEALAPSPPNHDDSNTPSKVGGISAFASSPRVVRERYVKHRVSLLFLAPNLNLRPMRAFDSRGRRSAAYIIATSEWPPNLLLHQTSTKLKSSQRQRVRARETTSKGRGSPRAAQEAERRLPPGAPGPAPEAADRSLRPPPGRQMPPRNHHTGGHGDLSGRWKPDVPQDHVASELVPRSVRLQLHVPSASISSTASYSSTDTALSARVMYVMEFSSRCRST